MNADEFNAILEGRIEKIRQTLAQKRAEYAPDEDVLHNFRRAGSLRGKPAAAALLGMLIKHWVSIEDIVTTHTRNPKFWADRAVVEEKVGDAINYLILLESLLKEART